MGMCVVMDDDAPGQHGIGKRALLRVGRGAPKRDRLANRERRRRRRRGDLRHGRRIPDIPGGDPDSCRRCRPVTVGHRDDGVELATRVVGVSHDSGRRVGGPIEEVPVKRERVAIGIGAA